MNSLRRFPVYVAASTIVIFIIYTYAQLYPRSWNSSPYIHSVLQEENSGRSVDKTAMTVDNKAKHFAYATSVCNEDQVEHALVLIHSIKTSKTTYPILAVVNDNISSQYEGYFLSLGAVIVRAHNADCNVAKMALWSLTSYNKIIYIDHGSVMIGNFDDMFDLPTNSLLLQNWPNYIEKLIVLKPSISTYDRLLKLSVHQQASTDGVLGTDLMADKFHPIPYAGVKLVGDKVRAPQNAKLLMFDGKIKPWDWYTAHDDAWLKNWDPDSMWQWRHHRNAIEYLFNGSKGLINSIYRSESVCNQKQLSKSFPITDKFSVLLSTYNPDRIDHVTTLIRHLATSDLVHTIYLTWHNPKLEVNKELKELQEKLRKPLVILPQQFDSLNNRFNPIEGLETSAVYILDDDIVVSVPDLEFSFQVWLNRQHSIVGHFPRFHSYNSTDGRAIYAMADAKRPTFSIVLTKSMFIRSEYLFAYTCLMDPALHEYVDANLNCEDIGFSLMVSGLTSVSNVYVAVKSRIRDYGLSQGISTNGNHIKARRQCISNMISTFWKGNDPTRMSSEIVSPFEAAHYTRGSWDQLAKEVENIEGRS